MSDTSPARLHILLARDSGTAVVIRRGPVQQTCLIGWNRSTDHFDIGQWAKVKIYEHRCDISPDGKHLIYFALNGFWDSETKGSWNAISKAPYLKALTLYPKGDTWGGGGLFTSNNTYWLNGCFEDASYATNALHPDETWKPATFYEMGALTVYFTRLQREEWSLVSNAKTPLGEETIFDKALRQGYILRKTFHSQVNHPQGKGIHWEEHEVLHHGETVALYPDWEWADWDRNRLVWAEAGCLYAAPELSDDPAENAACLYDFNSMQFEAIEAPY